MGALAARDDIELAIISPTGIPPWPLSLRNPYRELAANPAEFEFEGTPVFFPQFRQTPLVGWRTSPFDIAFNIQPLADRLHAIEPFDLVDAQFFYPDGPAAAQVAKSLGLPLSIKARGTDIHLWGERPMALGQMLGAALQAGGLLAVSEALKRDMIALGMPDDKITVHYSGLDHSRFRPQPRNEARAAVADLVPIDGPLLVSVGNLIPLKGHDLAIAALADLPNARLAIAGTGPEHERLRSLTKRLGCESRVHMLGRIGPETMPALLSAADAMVLPSENEGLANAWIEALACGTPLVITDVGGAREVVTSPSAGRLVERTPEAIAAGVWELLENPPSQAEVAQHAARFSWEANAAQLAAHYRLVAG
jgi:glycosyltransferase involved in cell wall biosynthesis